MSEMRNSGNPEGRVIKGGSSEKIRAFSLDVGENGCREPGTQEKTTRAGNCSVAIYRNAVEKTSSHIRKTYAEKQGANR